MTISCHSKAAKLNKNIDYIKNKTIFTFWTGSNPMSDQRSSCLENLRKNSGGSILLVTPSNLSSFILKNHPLHPCYEYLCETHKSDYLRTYFMHFYGGGYSDIKSPGGSWINAFEDLDHHPTAIINGYPETRPEDVGYKPYDCFYDLLLGNCSYICRPNTPFTKIWYEEMIKFIDSRGELLKKYPSTFPQDCSEKKTGYPIGWTELLGQIFHKHLMKFLPQLLYSVPRPICTNYR